MDKYVTGDSIKLNREKKALTQAELAERLHISDKTVSKWETGRGFPDITMLEPIANALGISIIELLSGAEIENKNTSGNMLRSKLYVCPVCGNVIHSVGDALISCCGIILPPLETETEDEEHIPVIEEVEDEYYIYVNHEMTKDHYISFIGCLTDCGFEFVKLYPEGNAEARFKRSRTRMIYLYCNRHGLFRIKVNKKKKA